MSVAEIIALLDLADSLLGAGISAYQKAQGLIEASTTLTDEERAVLIARIAAARDSVSKWE